MEGQGMKKTWFASATVLLSATLLLPQAEAGEHAAPDAISELQGKIKNIALIAMEDGTKYVNIGKAIKLLAGGNSGLFDNKRLGELIAAIAEQVPEKGAIYLGPDVDFGKARETIDLRRVKNGVAIQIDNPKCNIMLGGGQKGLEIFGGNITIAPGINGQEPLRELTALYATCNRINGAVVDSNFIASVNGWGAYGFRAEGRIDNTLFLWFSINWPFADYNAHLGKPDVDWWSKNCQAYFDLKNGGRNTRVYLMIETNYGNPGTGVWLKDCDGLAMYHGATERASSQGPGCYYLQNCRNVQLGLRRIFPGTRGGGKSAMPSHALTIEGGEGNILHFLSDFANAYGESFVNSDPKLQIWGAEFDFETKGVESDNILRFAYTPFNNAPEGQNKEEAVAFAEKNAAKWIEERAAAVKAPAYNTAENAAKLRELIKSGRDRWWPLNATHEETFVFAGHDLTKAPAKSIGLKLPPPPSIPATNAPRTFRPLYFTWEQDFGKALLEAGADPTGQKPSDDAFAKIMYNMSADEVARCYEAVIKNHDKEAYARLCPMDANNKLISRPRLDIPAGTFLLTKTLLLTPGSNGIMGAGPDKTILKFKGDITAIKQIGKCHLYNFTVDGGKIGLAITGDDHGASGLLRTSYIAGFNYYNLTFRNQTFAGIHIGTDDIEVMGGAEHDQNKYVNLKFLNTGEYGIYMNHNMLDKWLLLKILIA